MIELPPAFFIYMPGLKPPILLPVLRFLAPIYLGLRDSPSEIQPSFYSSVSKLTLSFLITLLLPLQLSLSLALVLSPNSVSFVKFNTGPTICSCWFITLPACPIR